MDRCYLLKIWLTRLYFYESLDGLDELQEILMKIKKIMHS